MGRYDHTLTPTSSSVFNSSLAGDFVFIIYVLLMTLVTSSPTLSVKVHLYTGPSLASSSLPSQMAAILISSSHPQYQPTHQLLQREPPLIIPSPSFHPSISSPARHQLNPIHGIKPIRPSFNALHCSFLVSRPNPP